MDKLILLVSGAIILGTFTIPITAILWYLSNRSARNISSKNQKPLDRNTAYDLQQYVKDADGNNLYPDHTPECGIWCKCSGCDREWR